MSDIRSRARDLLAEVEEVADRIDADGMWASTRDHERREELDRELAELVPELLDALDGGRGGGGDVSQDADWC